MVTEPTAALAAVDVNHPTIGHGFAAVNIVTMANTGIALLVLLAAAVIVRIRLRADRPGRLQSVLEVIIEFVNGLVRDTLGEKPIRLAPVAITLFAFLLVSNWVGLIPLLRSPTNDVNTAAALALFSIAMLHFYSIRFRGPRGYLAHYFSVVTPSWKNPFGAVARILFGVLEIIQELAKPLTLTFRLYFNIFVGELLLTLIISLLGYASPLAGVPWLLFSLFVGAVQAFIFTMLTIAYIAQGTDTAHTEAH